MLGALFGSSSGRVAHVGRARQSARRYVDLVGLQMKHDTPCELLNVPERKRLEIARVLAARPKLLLLDEVMAGLSGQEMTDMLVLLRNVRDTGVTIIIIEHVMHAIRRLAQRVIVLHHGEKIADGQPDRVFSEASVIEHYMGKASRPA